MRSYKDFLPNSTSDGGTAVADPSNPVNPTTPRYSNPRNPPPTSSPQGSSFDNYLALFKDSPYANDPSFQNLIKAFASRGDQFGANNAQPTFDQVSGYADEFRAQFNNLAGRDPNSQEYGQFFKHLANESPQNAIIPSSTMQSDVQGLLNTQFSSTIADAAQKKAQGQADAAVAPGSAFDTWQQAMQSNVQSTQKTLQDYQAKLFEKLQPQLMTSLQAKGLLNTGALNEAFAGAAKDLTDANTGYVAGIQNQANTDIANTKYGIESSPGNFALQNTFNTVPNLTSSGQNALNNAFNYNSNLALASNSFNNNRDLLNQQYANQPSYLQQLGGQMAGGALSGWAFRGFK